MMVVGKNLLFYQLGFQIFYLTVLLVLLLVWLPIFHHIIWWKL